MMAWAMAESLFDVYLLLKGESIPIFKTRNTWITDYKKDFRQQLQMKLLIKPKKRLKMLLKM